MGKVSKSSRLGFIRKKHYEERKQRFQQAYKLYSMRNELRAELCRRDFFYFLQYFWPVVSNDPPVWNWHIKYLCNELAKMAQRVANREPKQYDLVINIPPGTTKSTICSVMLPVWCWVNWYWMCFIVASYSGALALEHAEKSRDIVRSDRFKALFPHLSVKKDKDTKSNFRIVRHSKGEVVRPGGNRYSTSVGGTLTGFHGHILIVDDPVDPNRAVSEKELQSANRWIDQTLSTRKADKEVTPVILIMQRLHQCLHPDTRVWTQKGFTRVVGVRQGERVLTSGGWQNVLEVGCRLYRGEMVGLRVSGHPEIPWMTVDHKVYTARGWVSAGDLTRSDMLLFPLPTRKEMNSSEIRELWPPLPYEEKTPKMVKEGFKGNEKRVPYTELKRLVDKGWTSRQMADYFGFATRQMIDLYIAKYKIVRKKALTVNSDLLFDSDFWRIVGYWVAEGSLVKGRRGINGAVRFTFGNKDGELIEDAVGVLKRHGFNPTVRDNKYNTFTLFCSSYQLALFFEMFGTSAKDKRIPEWMLSLPIGYIQQFIKGYWLGDGCIARNYVRFTSISLELLTGVQRLLLQMGIVSSIYKNESPIKSCVIKSGPGKGRKIKGRHPLYELRVARRDVDDKLWEIGLADVAYTKKPVNKIRGGYLYVKILDILKRDYSGLVYDITTPTHDFLVGLTMLHNSDPSGHILKKWKGVRLICLPGEIQNYREQLQPPELHRYYVNDLLDPVRMSWGVLADMQAELGQYGYAGQVGQHPVPPGGGMFRVEHFQIATQSPLSIDIVEVVRYWDKAGTEGGGAYTVGVKMCKLNNGKFMVLDVRRGRWSSDERERIIREVAEVDGSGCVVYVEQEPGSGGKESAEGTVRNLAGFHVEIDRPTGNKVYRADPYSVQVNAGNVVLLQGGWNEEFIEEHRFFPHGTYKDQVDAAAGAFNALARGVGLEQIVVSERGKRVSNWWPDGEEEY